MNACRRASAERVFGIAANPKHCDCGSCSYGYQIVREEE